MSELLPTWDADSDSRISVTCDPKIDIGGCIIATCVIPSIIWYLMCRLIGKYMLMVR
jgi:hypothetical protein